MRTVTLTVGDRLPAVTLDAADGQPVELRRTRHDSSVLIVAHPDCEACRDYVASFAETGDELAAWGGRVMTVTPAAAPVTGGRFAGHRQLADPDDRVRSGVGLSAEQAAVLVTDRFGTVYLAQVGGAEHDLPTPQQLLEEVRHVVTQCPECGVPDDPLRGEEAWRR